MIKAETLIELAQELCVFVNAPAPRVTYRDPEFQDLTEDDPQRDPGSLKPNQRAGLHTKAKNALSVLAQIKQSSKRDNERLQKLAADWLTNPLPPLVCKAHSMDLLSMSATGRVQITPHFVNDAVKYAAIFAELIQDDSPALIKRCTTCQTFFVYLRGARGQPRKLCDLHYEQSKRTRKTTSPRKHP